MRLEFKNRLGTISMSGGGEDNVRITGISGLGVPQYERRTYSSYDFDGIMESMKRFPARNITVSGDIKGTVYDAAEIARILSEPSEMKIVSDSFVRIISVNACDVQFTKKSDAFVKFAMSAVCDDPYFYDSDYHEVGLYKREALIDSDTVLPAMFSKRTSSASIKITSHRDVEPIITILGKRNPDETEGKIVIKNRLTGAEFVLLYVPDNDEIITIDVSKRTIKSDKNGNLIGFISDDSFLSDLIIGEQGAEFVTTGYGAAGNIDAYIKYKNKYIEAMV